MYIVNDTPIRKNNKTYGVGEEFPYSDKDKSLLQKGYLKEVKDDVSGVASTKMEAPNLSAKSSKAEDRPTKKAAVKKIATATKKVATKKKTDSKK